MAPQAENAKIVDVEIVGDDVQPNFANDDAAQMNDQFEEASANEQGFNGHSLNGVPDYNDPNLAADVKAGMDVYIDSIDPYDFNTISNLGAEELNNLSNVANQVRESMENDADLVDTIEDAQEAISGIDFGAMAGAAASTGSRGIKYLVNNPGTALTTAGASLVLGPLALGLPYAKHKLDSIKANAKAKEDGSDMQEAVRETVQNIDQVIGALQDSKEKIPHAIGNLREIGKARIEMYLAVSLIIGAAMEKLRRLDEEEIFDMQQELDTNPGDVQLADDLMNIKMGRDTLEKRVNAMFASRVVSEVSVVSLQKMQQALHTAGGKIDDHLTVSAPQWNAQIAEAAVGIAANKISQVLAEADESGDRILQQSVELGARTNRMIAESNKRGTYDHKKVIKVIENMQTQFKADIKQLGSPRQAMLEAREELSSASQKFQEKYADHQAKVDGRLAISSGGHDFSQPALEDNSSAPAPGDVAAAARAAMRKPQAKKVTAAPKAKKAAKPQPQPQPSQ